MRELWERYCEIFWKGVRWRMSPLGLLLETCIYGILLAVLIVALLCHRFSVRTWQDGLIVLVLCGGTVWNGWNWYHRARRGT